MVANSTKEPVWIKIDSPNIPILTPCDHHIVSDGDECVRTVWVAGELVRV